MTQQRIRLVPLGDPVARFQSADVPVDIAEWAEVCEWVPKPDTFMYDYDTLVRYEWPTGEFMELENPFRSLKRSVRRALGIRLRQPKTNLFEVMGVYERINRLVVWTDELLGPQARKETVEREGQTLRLVRWEGQ